MIITAGTHLIWPGFKLENSEAIELQLGSIYHLRGANGSGKSSFIKQLLLPTLLAKRQDHYIIYLEQQMHKQLYALKAGAALAAYPQQIECEADAVDYLLHDLGAALQLQSRSVYAICDESPCLQHFITRLQQMNVPSCVLFSSHEPNPGLSNRCIDFAPLNQQLSRFYESKP